ncbi:MAG TPA: Wzz/FepE/Etk N-terminal domain-containing protein [Xanthobacteraceae bacterium]|nr:Wzz/FepE/Etk N-terminal domain-containing protein [Xanthobacteraceae bacterium]
MSLATLREIIRARRLTFLSVTLLVFGGTVAFCLLATPIYRSEALVMISQGRTHTDRTEFPDTIRFEINSQIYVIQSDDVLREAIATIGPQTLFPGRSDTIVDDLRDRLGQSGWAAWLGLDLKQDTRTDVDRALLKVRKRLSVSAEKDSQVLWLGFRHEDPKVAERFLNLVLDGFVRRQVALSGNTAAPEFFRDQAARYRADYTTASARLNDFAKKHSTYSVRQEIELALKRRDGEKAALAATQGAIADNTAQIATLQNTLAQLRRRISLPAEITGPKVAAPATGTTGDAFKDNKVPANESPLLLVKVFQESAQSLVNLNSRTVGLRALEQAQTKDVAELEDRLARLSTQEAEFLTLKSEVDQAQKILEAHIGRAADAQTNADLETSDKLARVKVVQSATSPLEPVFPQVPLFLTLGAAIALLAGAAASVARDGRVRSKLAAPNPAPASDIESPVTLPLRWRAAAGRIVEDHSMAQT